MVSRRARRFRVVLLRSSRVYISGYSRLMQIDEEGTHSRVKRIERDLIEPSITEHHGRLVKTTGDGFIAIFDSPVEAVRCSIVIQQNLIGRNASLPKTSWIEYRIGVNLGDVIIEPDDVYGDGVNIAARLEGIADPGQVYISGGIYEQIKHKLVCGDQLLGDRKIKNITDPVRVYRVLPDPAAYQARRKRRENVLILLSLTLLAIGGGKLLVQSLATAWPKSSVPLPSRLRQSRRRRLHRQCQTSRKQRRSLNRHPKGTGRAAAQVLISGGTRYRTYDATGFFGPRARNDRT